MFVCLYVCMARVCIDICMYVWVCAEVDVPQVYIAHKELACIYVTHTHDSIHLFYIFACVGNGCKYHRWLA
jgi:hypothetical protein